MYRYMYVHVVCTCNHRNVHLKNTLNPKPLGRAVVRHGPPHLANKQDAKVRRLMYVFVTSPTPLTANISGHSKGHL